MEVEPKDWRKEPQITAPPSHTKIGSDFSSIHEKNSSSTWGVWYGASAEVAAGAQVEAMPKLLLEARSSSRSRAKLALNFYCFYLSITDFTSIVIITSTLHATRKFLLFI